MLVKHVPVHGLPCGLDRTDVALHQCRRLLTTTIRVLLHIVRVGLVVALLVAAQSGRAHVVFAAAWGGTGKALGGAGHGLLRGAAVAGGQMFGDEFDLLPAQL